MKLSCKYCLLYYPLKNLCCKKNKTTEAQIGIGQYADSELKEE
jgi:hypothetical protein